MHASLHMYMVFGRTEADPDVLSDYIIALLENSTDPVGTAQFESQMAGKLEDFLGSSTYPIFYT